jgi:hypothetical protein
MRTDDRCADREVARGRRLAESTWESGALLPEPLRGRRFVPVGGEDP